MSRLFGETLRDAPAGVEAAGHQFLLRAGYVRQIGQGIFAYLPLAWQSMLRIQQILREELTAIGGAEVSLPVVHPAEIWQQSGRYQAIGAELTRFEDRRAREMVLAMTHEEVVASLAASEISSYRQLPKLVFQIQIKWRDDPRPRAGMIRAREFTMKDSYSLDLDEAGLDVQYRAHYEAYFKIFARCGLPVIAVGADVGMMGGSAAHEFMYLTPLGEDTLVLCDACGYAQNRQVATSRKAQAKPEQAREARRVETPHAATIEELAALLGVDTARTAKIVFLAAEQRGEDGGPVVRLVVGVVRGDTELNEAKLSNLLGGAELRPMTLEEIATIGAVAGYASPIGLKGGEVVADVLVMSSPNLVAGANEEGWHLLDTNVGRDWQPGLVADIVSADDGDGCPNCGAPLRTERGVEVGNIFKLGTKYADSFGATYLDPDGNTRPIVMGSYGIGVGRLLACVAEEHHDERGLRLPAAVAPYLVHLTVLRGSDPPVGEAAERVYATLEAAGIGVLFDDRGERPGVQFADADLIGLPVRLTVSERSLAAGGVELKRRDAEESRVVAEETLPAEIRAELGAPL
jgi:prolyl-tRNA synthetase